MGLTSALAFAAAAAAALSWVADVEATWTSPQIGMGWQWELFFNTIPNVATPNVPVWDIDPERLVPSDIPVMMNALRAHNRYIICYVNVGALDPGAVDWNAFTAVTPTIIDTVSLVWDFQYLLDIRRNETRALIKARFQRMASYGCHGIQTDNLDVYSLANKFGLTVDNAVDYMKWISATVHSLGMAVGLKDCGNLVTPRNLVPVFDFAVVDSCADFTGMCAEFTPFIQAGKPVFAAEYTDAGSAGCPVVSSPASACATTNAQNFEGILKSCDLGPEWQGCQADAISHTTANTRELSSTTRIISKFADAASDTNHQSISHHHSQRRLQH
ncbi:Glycoside-hydrolase family GH114 TIM-barrel domain-containing protein [Plasmodiophora brassicae]